MAADGSSQEQGKKRNLWRRLHRTGDGPSSTGPEEVPGSWEGKGDVLYEADKLNEALECYTRGLTEEPKNLDLWMKKAEIFLDHRRFRSGLFCIDQALRLEDDLPEVWLMRGILLHEAGDQAGALESIDFSLSLKGDNAEAWTAKGSCLVELDRFEDARTSLRYAKEMDPDNKDLATVLKKLEEREEGSKVCPLCEEPTKAGRCEKCILDIHIEDARLSIDMAKENGKDITEAQELLIEARSFQDKDFGNQALKVLRPLHDILGDDWKEGAHVLVVVEEAEEIATALEDDHTRGTLSIRERTKRARSSIEQDRPIEAMVRAMDAVELARKLAKKHSELFLREPEKKMKKAPIEGPACPECGEEVEDGWIKCPVCKAGLGGKDGVASPAIMTSDPEKAPAPKEGAICPACGEEIEEIWEKCLFCGASLKDREGGGG